MKVTRLVLILDGTLGISLLFPKSQWFYLRVLISTTSWEMQATAWCKWLSVRVEVQRRGLCSTVESFAAADADDIEIDLIERW